jgi:hypothetical protein
MGANRIQADFRPGGNHLSSLRAVKAALTSGILTYRYCLTGNWGPSGWMPGKALTTRVLLYIWPVRKDERSLFRKKELTVASASAAAREYKPMPKDKFTSLTGR